MIGPAVESAGGCVSHVAYGPARSGRLTETVRRAPQPRAAARVDLARPVVDGHPLGVAVEASDAGALRAAAHRHYPRVTAGGPAVAAGVTFAGEAAAVVPVLHLRRLPEADV